MKKTIINFMFFIIATALSVPLKCSYKKMKQLKSETVQGAKQESENLSSEISKLDKQLNDKLFLIQELEILSSIDDTNEINLQIIKLKKQANNKLNLIDQLELKKVHITQELKDDLKEISNKFYSPKTK